MHRRTENNTHGICHDVLPTPMVALGAIVMHLLGNGTDDGQQWTDNREGKASTKVLYLVLALVRVIAVVHCSF